MINRVVEGFASLLFFPPPKMWGWERQTPCQRKGPEQRCSLFLLPHSALQVSLCPTWSLWQETETSRNWYCLILPTSAQEDVLLYITCLKSHSSKLIQHSEWRRRWNKKEYCWHALTATRMAFMKNWVLLQSEWAVMTENWVEGEERKPLILIWQVFVAHTFAECWKRWEVLRIIFHRVWASKIGFEQVKPCPVKRSSKRCSPRGHFPANNQPAAAFML